MREALLYFIGLYCDQIVAHHIIYHIKWQSLHLPLDNCHDNHAHHFNKINEFTMKTDFLFEIRVESGS